MTTNIGGGCSQDALFCTVEVSSTEKNLIGELRDQLNSLMVRIEELQRENDRLISRISRCQCSEVKQAEPVTYYFANSERIGQNIQQDGGLSISESNTNTSHSNNQTEVSSKEDKHRLHVEKFSNCTSLEQAKPTGQYFTSHECTRRYVALKIMYFGQRFFGFASEAQMEPTVEMMKVMMTSWLVRTTLALLLLFLEALSVKGIMSEIFKALERTKLLVGTRKNSHYSRCGRTDKGVSATNQVVSLYLRSNGKDNARGNQNGTWGKNFGEEINYVMVLNRVLPKDIRVVGWAPISSEFSARFSCLSREYMYLFWSGTMDISVMQKAAQKFIGEHDFRNFCKMDAVNVNNYRRHISEFAISPLNKGLNDDKLWAITIKGSAFLWHQVRCMISVLFMIGEGLESPNIIDVLLDINKTPRKPQYNMASEFPLMLHCCEFQDVNFICSSDARRNLQEHFTIELKTYLLQAAIIEEALHCLQTTGVEETSREHRRKKKGHISLMLRPTEPSYEERRAKWAMKSAYSRSAF